MADPSDPRAANATEADAAATNGNVAYEHSDWHLGVIGLTLLGIFLFLVIAPLALIWAFPDALPDADRRLQIQLPAPRLQTNPPQDLANFLVNEQQQLTTYYWIDKPHGVVHIPIAQAMAKLAHDGADGFPRADRP